MDVLYSLLSINNQRLDIIAQDEIFTNILNFVSTSSNNDISSISNLKLNRFCVEILPRIQQNVKCLILESTSIEYILLAADYPNLTQLKLFNFNKQIASRYFRDDSVIQHISKQITVLNLISNENGNENMISILCLNDIMNAYENILIFFKDLKCLTIVPLSFNHYSFLSLTYSSTNTFFSSTLTKLCINVDTFDDCLGLLDGRLKQLITFFVKINSMNFMPRTAYNMDDLLNLKCFSLICYERTCLYDNLVVPLLRRMSNLEELTLYVCILNRPTFVDGIHLYNEMLIHMAQLHKFTFYINTTSYINDPIDHLSNSDIQQTFSNIDHCQVACILDYFDTFEAVCHVFSLPFLFDRLEWISNNFPPITFSCVTYLGLSDSRSPFKPEFFVRVARSFPSLKYLSVENLRSPYWTFYKYSLVDDHSCSIIEYPHLVSLNISFAHSDYIDQFLNESKTHLPCLTELEIQFDDLKEVTANFTRDATRRNCAKVKRLIDKYSSNFSEDIYRYFPSL